MRRGDGDVGKYTMSFDEHNPSTTRAHLALSGPLGVPRQIRLTESVFIFMSVKAALETMFD